MKKRLLELKNGDYPLEEQSYKNALAVIECTPEDVLDKWNVFPSLNGTVSFEYKAKEIIAVSVGNTHFSFVAVRGDKVISGKRVFCAEDIRDTFTLCASI